VLVFSVEDMILVSVSGAWKSNRVDIWKALAAFDTFDIKITWTGIYVGQAFCRALVSHTNLIQV
jgi:hypothetical protein